MPTRLPAERILPAEIAELGVGHLQLDGRAAALVAPFRTIGDLMLGFETGAIRSAGGRLQLRRLLNSLTAALRENGSDGWDHRPTRSSG